MRKGSALLLLLLCAVVGLYAVENEWGIKYGMGVSKIFGDEAAHNLHYDISTINTVTGAESELGYLSLDSSGNKRGSSYNFGVYYTRQLIKEMDSVWLHTELLWQRYNFSYEFSGNALRTNDLLLSAAFADTLEGSIDQALDYITIPVLIKLRQGLPSDNPNKHYNGAYVYLGPAFSFKLNGDSSSHMGIKALENDITDFIEASYSDPDANNVYASFRRQSGADKVLVHRTDFVIGLGFNLKDVFNLGIGRDEFFFDFRFTGGLYPIGDAATKTDFKLQSAILSLGVRL